MAHTSSAETNAGLGRRIAEFRERHGIKQRELAERVDLSPTFLSEIENGKRNVSSDTLLRLANVLGASLDFLLRGIEAPPPAREVVVPPELSQAADQHGWTYGQTVALLQTRRTVLAKRSPSGQAEKSVETMSADDWVRFYERLFGDD